MEKGINQYFLEKFGMKQADIRSYSPLTLAYIGDGISVAFLAMVNDFAFRPLRYTASSSSVNSG